MAGIYIHIPFCKKACHYCNFYFSTSLGLKEKFMNALCKEIEIKKDYLYGESIETIYFGGGTPSLFPSDDIKIIVEKIHQSFPNISLKEFTIEANPDDLSQEKLKAYKTLKSFGLNRFSIGVQSFHPVDLAYMNRIHSANEAQTALKTAADTGFENITIDLIYGVPTCTDEMWVQNLDTAFSLGIKHISCYALTVEKKTYLEKYIREGKKQAVDEWKTSRQFDILMQQMKANQFEQYEISNFAKDKNYAIHNTAYWQGKNYIGLGPSAHSFNGFERSWNIANIKNYHSAMESGAAFFELEILSEKNKINELLLTQLRTIWGVNLLHPLLKNHQVEIHKSLQNISPEFYFIKEQILYLTDKGKHYADKITAELFID